MYDPKREKEMLLEIINNMDGTLSSEYVMEIFEEIFENSRNVMQKKIKNIQRTRKTLEDIIPGEAFDVPLIAGPCSVESMDQMILTGRKVKEVGVKLLRGGAYKPRTSPFDFQGHGLYGLEILRSVAREFGLIIVSEIVDIRNVELKEEYVDVLQIGARNMFNYELLKEVGKSHKPVLLKRGFMSTIKEYIYAVEYIRMNGNENIILCERGIRTFENVTRNTLDIAAVPILKRELGLPVVVDLSHSLGRKDLVMALGKACLAAGADLLMVEVHPNPEEALSDVSQQLNFEEFSELIKSLQ